MKRTREKPDRNGFDEWGGYMNAKKSKLAEQFSTESSKSGIQSDDLFKGIAIFVNGFTDPSSDELKKIMMRHGGVYHHYHYSERTTHIIASNLPDSKVKQMKGLKVVKPSWIVDSIKAGKVLDYCDYLLYTNQSKTQPALSFQATNLKEVTQESKPVLNNLEEHPKASGSNNGHEANSSENSNWLAKNASDEKFLSEFYRNSRLHLISTMGAKFKEYINELRLNENHTFPGMELLKDIKKTDEMKATNVLFNEMCREESLQNIIMHIDMDCFFVSVGIRNRPELKGLPIAVTHAKGNRKQQREGMNPKQELIAYKKKLDNKCPNNDRNLEGHWLNSINETDSMAEIASCSYEAREAGVKNGMFLGQALKICPNLKTISYDFEAYKEVSYMLYNTIARYTLNIEAVSCDEMFVDCSEILSVAALSPTEFASIVRKEIKDKTGCPCSTGFGNNRLQARLATKKAKPDGQFYLQSDEVEEFMNGIRVAELPGVGRSTSYKLNVMGIKTCQELKEFSLSKLQQEFGQKVGDTLYKNARGIDERNLIFEKVRKSVSAEINYGIRFQNDTERDIFLKQLSEEVSSRLLEVKMKGRCITLKLMIRAKDAPEETTKYMGHGVCDSINKSVTLSGAISDASIIFREVSSILKKCHVNTKDLRGVGIQVSRLEKNVEKCSNILTKFLSKKQNSEKESVSSDKQKDLNDQGNHSSPKELSSEIGTNFSPRPSGLNAKNQLTVSISEKISTGEEVLEVDASFLEALPDDLKREVLKNMKHHKTTPVLIESGDVEQSKSPNNGQIEDVSPQKIEESRSYVSPRDMKAMIKEWVNSQDKPQACDISLLGEYLQQMVVSRKIEDLHVLLKTFYREINKNVKLSFWMDAYKRIIENVQDKMINVYGAKIMIKETFDTT